jgi:hypothetical protein
MIIVLLGIVTFKNIMENIHIKLLRQFWRWHVHHCRPVSPSHDINKNNLNAIFKLFLVLRRVLCEITFSWALLCKYLL